MAIDAGYKVEHADINDIYTSFNTFISNFGGNIQQLTAPTQYSLIDDTHFNNLNDKITEFKDDTYLGSQPSWWINATVTEGTYLDDANFTNIFDTMNNFPNVKCRNDAYNSHGYNDNSYSNGENEWGDRTHGAQSNGVLSNGAGNGHGWMDSWASSPNGLGTNQANGKNTYGWCNSNGGCGTNGICRNQTHIDISNTHTN